MRQTAKPDICCKISWFKKKRQKGGLMGLLETISSSVVLFLHSWKGKLPHIKALWAKYFSWECKDNSTCQMLLIWRSYNTPHQGSLNKLGIYFLEFHVQYKSTRGALRPLTALRGQNQVLSAPHPDVLAALISKSPLLCAEGNRWEGGTPGSMKKVLLPMLFLQTSWAWLFRMAVCLSKGKVKAVGH